jgi:MFS superfamily sulfate permease-like transporter
VIVVVLLVLVPLMRTLPNAALAAIIFIAFKSIVKQLSEVVSSHHHRRRLLHQPRAHGHARARVRVC